MSSMVSCQTDNMQDEDCGSFYSLEDQWNSIKQTSSVWDLLSGEHGDDAVLTKKEAREPLNPSPYIRFTDLNNTGTEMHNKNKPKSAIEIGLKFSF